MDGGFRGVKGLRGSVTSEQQLAAVEDFQRRLLDFDRTSAAVVERLRQASLPQAEAVEVERARQELHAAINAHILASSNVSSSQELMDWRTEAGRLVGLANTFVAHARTALVAETGTRPWKIVLAILAGTAVVTGAAWALSRVQ